ncbi:MAG: antibiotic biosynthesis monooxygenase [Chloroflexota bacterium]|nr:antibiotic biosynthesis monooxygenase [Chloroflexota bacterium]
MIVAISRIRITSGNADAVAAQYQQRSQLVEQAPGFLGLEILRGQDQPDEFMVCMRWVDRAAFEAYRSSPQFRQAHQNIRTIPGHTHIDRATYAVGVFDVIAH